MRRLMLWIGGLVVISVVLVAIFYAVMIAAAIALAGIVLLAVMEGYARFRIWRARER